MPLAHSGKYEYYTRVDGILPGSVVFEEGNEYLQRSWHCGPHNFHVPTNLNQLI